MKKNALRGYTVLAILLIVFSVIAFVVPFTRTGTFWAGYGFGVFAIAFQLYIFRIADASGGTAKSRFYGFPIARVGVYYFAVQLILSIVEMALAGMIPLWPVLIVNILLAALLLIGCIAAEAMRDEIIRQDSQLKKDVFAMREMQSLSRSLVGQCQDEALKPALEKLADEFRYSDPVTSENTRELEEDMRSQLGDIQQALVEGDSDGAKKLCGKLLWSLTERSRICSVSK